MIRATPEGGFPPETPARRADTVTTGAGQGQQQLQQQRGAGRGQRTPPPGQIAGGAPLIPPAPQRAPNLFSVQPGPNAGRGYHFHSFDPLHAYAGLMAHPWLPPAPGIAMPYPAAPMSTLWPLPDPVGGMPCTDDPGLTGAAHAPPPQLPTPIGRPALQVPPHTLPTLRPATFDAGEPQGNRRAIADDCSDCSDCSDDSDDDNVPSRAEPIPRYSPDDLARMTELKVNTGSAEELFQLAKSLPSNETITRVTVDGDVPEVVHATLNALCHNQTVQTLRIECSSEDFAPKLVDKLTRLLEKKTPLRHLELLMWDWDGEERKLKLDQAFFTGLFSHPHLKTINIDVTYEDSVYLHSPQQLAELVRSNSSLQHLRLYRSNGAATLIRAIGPGLEKNRSLRVLDLRRSELTGCGQALAAVLEANTSIYCVNLQFSWLERASECEQIIDALAKNTGITEFYFDGIMSPDRERPALGAAISAMLKANRHLTSLSIHCKLDVANIVLIRQGLHANTSLRFFDPGDIVVTDNNDDSAEAIDALNALFATNSRLTAVRLHPPPGSSLPSSPDILRGLERNRSVTAVSLLGASGIDDLISLLNNNPRIAELELTRFLPAATSDVARAKQLETIADQIQGNTTLLRFSFDREESGKRERPAIAKALARFDILTLRNQQLEKQRQQQLQRITAPARGLQMLSGFRQNNDENWPALGNEEAFAVASAIDTVLPPQEAQRVLDALRFADIVNAQDEKASSGEHE